MTKRFVMTLNRILYSMLVCIALTACNKNNGILGDDGYYLNFIQRPSEYLVAYQNDYQKSCIDTSCADLRIVVTDDIQFGNQANETCPDETNRDKTLECQITKFLDPTGNLYNGDIPINIEYRNEKCLNVKIKLYGKDRVYLSDVTDSARFYYVNNKDGIEEIGKNLLIDSKSNLIGKIPIGMKISEYLTHSPKIFSEAHFILENVPRELFDDGYYANIEIELSNGKKITANSLMRKTNSK